jgi:hypothetical protein
MSERDTPALPAVPATPLPPDATPAYAAGLARLTGLLGIVFAGLLTAGLVMVHRSPPLAVSEADYTTFYRDGGQTILVTVGIYLVPFAGIAFLWHMTTVRLLVRALTPAPTAIPFALQAVAGGLFVGLLFAGTASAGAVALLDVVLVFPGWVALIGLIVLVCTGRSGARMSSRS